MSATRMLCLEIVAGETTCFDPEARASCQFRGRRYYGTRYVCELFWAEDGQPIELCDENGEPSGPGMLQRLPQCLSAESKRISP